MKRLLIANRGEIAVRIIRACREMGITPLAVYSEADRNALHVGLAEEAVCIGAAPAKDSYLNISNLLDAAKQLKADAVHPGYGFLSENADFALACEKAGLVFVGPPSGVIRLLGDKIAAKQLMRNAGVPVIPGYYGDEQSDARLQAEAGQMELPLLVKAAGGGGGRGMRVVTQREQLADAIDEARREAQAAFGDDRLLLERYVARPRHIEVQIFGDAQGNVVHLFERECSIQRRHQKILEESPSPILTPELRARMTDAATAAGRAAGYVNAGTVEFLLETRPNGEFAFYFLEVNTRLQVEHPVTETITGLDLVRLQLQIADGKLLPFAQEELRISGHALEARIYAEDAATGFLPSAGNLAQWQEPTGPGIRVDAGVERGSDVSPYYDPMLAKLIVSGATREESLNRMEQALRQFAVLGVQTNIAYLLAIVRHPAFQAGDLSTQFLNDHFAEWKPSNPIPKEVLLALAAEAVTTTPNTEHRTPAPNPWQQSGSWRNV